MNYADPWREFLSLLSENKKGFFKKPDYDRILSRMTVLSKVIEDDGIFENAATVHAEMASIYKTLEKHTQREQHLIDAANLLIKHMERKRRVLSKFESPFKHDAFEFYNAAVKSADENGCKAMAGIYALGGANRMKDVESFVLADRLYRRAYYYHEGNYPMQVTILWNMAEISVAQKSLNRTLNVMDKIWMLILKSRTETKTALPYLQQCEMITVLLLTRLRKRIILTGRHKSILELYSVKFFDADSKVTKEAEKEKTTLEDVVFKYFSVLIHLYASSELSEAAEKLNSRDYSFISGIVRNVCVILLEKDLIID